MAFVEGISLYQVILVLLLLVIPILYQANKAFKYNVKLTVYYAIALLTGVVVVCVGAFRPRSPKNHVVVQNCVHYILRPILGMDLTIRGSEHLKTDQPCIVVINHQSSIDMIPLFHIWPENCVSLAKRQILYFTGSFGLGAWLCGTIYIDRLNHESARKTMEDTANRIKTKQLKVVIFPEGTRNHGGSMLPFKKGAFHLAVQGQVPIVPVVFSSYSQFYDKNEKRFDEGKVLVEILPPISTEGLTAENVTDLTEKTRNIMLESFDRMNEELKTMK